MAEAEQTAQMLRAGGADAVACQADVRDAVRMTGVATSILERWSRLDVVVACAGLGHSGLVARTGSDTWEQLMAVNLTGAFHTLRAAGPLMTAQGTGHVILIGSYAGSHGHAGQAAYAASKAGLIGLARTAAREWADTNVRVNVVFPGWHRTELSGGAMPDRPDADHLLGRTPDLDEVARTVVHLATCRDVSGQVWNLDSRPLP